ncbi:MAG: hypothetical protein AB7U99_02490, partial [Steroidobacteraceae bacterium]
MNLKSELKRDLLWGFAFTASVCSGSVLAQQTQAAAGTVRLEEVVVSAQRYDQTLQTTPVSVVAMDAEQITAIGADSLKSFEAFMPNVSIGTAMGT